MNYYKQGDAAKADQIKAAFKEKGYRDQGWMFSSKHDLYFSVGTLIYAIPYKIRHIITGRPDYQELELPVEPKYKDGDVLVTTKIRSCPFIYRKTDYNNNLAYYYVGIDGNGNLSIGWPKRTLCHFGLIADAVIAGQGQRDLLFKKMREAGYEWDADKKELKKIPKHYDIANLKPFDKVLVRDEKTDKWIATFYSYYRSGENYHHYNFVTIGTDDIWIQCSPTKATSICLGLLICLMNVILTGKD